MCVPIPRGHRYFDTAPPQSSGGPLPAAAATTSSDSVTMVTKCPLYLQDHKHSRLVVGVVVPRRDGSERWSCAAGPALSKAARYNVDAVYNVLLVTLDPIVPWMAMKYVRTSCPTLPDWRCTALVSPAQLSSSAYQIVYTTGPECGLPQSAQEVDCNTASERIALV